jgi:hypothetical protein
MLWRHQNKTKDKDWQRDKVLTPIEAPVSSKTGHESLLSRLQRERNSSTGVGSTGDNGVQMFGVSAGVCIIGSLVCTVWGLYTIASWHEMTTWPTTSATISSNYIKSHKGSGTEKLVFRPKLTYAYTIKNKEYTGDDSVGDGLPDQSAAEDALKKYQPGTKIDIRYSATNPNRSIWNLQQFCAEGLGLVVWAFAWFIVAAICAGLAWSAHATVIRTQNRQSNDASSIGRSKSRWRSGQ